MTIKKINKINKIDFINLIQEKFQHLPHIV